MLSIRDRMKCLNKTDLQVIAIIAMVVDHMSFLAPTIFWYYAFKFVGKITIIIMCRFVAEGFHRTHDLRGYIIRMGVFAAIAEIPFYLFECRNNLPTDIIGWIKGMYFCRNVIFTLFIGLCLLAVIKSNWNILFKLIAAALAWVLTRHSDWRYYALLWILAFGLFFGNPKKQLFAAALVVLWRFLVFFIPIIVLLAEHYIPESAVLSAFTGTLRLINNGDPTYAALYSSIDQLGCFLAFPLIGMYNGKKGNAPRMLFYIFYPAHLLVLFLIKLLVL